MYRPLQYIVSISITSLLLRSTVGTSPPIDRRSTLDLHRAAAEAGAGEQRTVCRDDNISSDDFFIIRTASN